MTIIIRVHPGALLMADMPTPEVRDDEVLVQEANWREVTRLFDAGVIRPVMDRVFPFDSTNDALAYVDAGRAKGKVVVKVR